MNIIGGADGPTAVFVAGRLGVSWLNTFGLVIVIIMLIPNIIYAIKCKNIENKCTNKAMLVIEQIGRYASMFFLIFNIGLGQLGFSLGGFLLYFMGSILLLIVYLIIWVLFFKKKTMVKSMALAIIPTAIFLICGVTLKHYLLLISGVIFGIGHIYVTYENGK